MLKRKLKFLNANAGMREYRNGGMRDNVGKWLYLDITRLWTDNFLHSSIPTFLYSLLIADAQDY